MRMLRIEGSLEKIILLVLMFVLLSLPVHAQHKSFGSATKLPSELVATQIKYLEVGKHGFTVPKAMVVDEDGDCYLLGWVELEMHKEFPRYWIIRVERKVDGFYVFVSNQKAKWSRERILYRGDKLRDMDLIPVKKIITVTALKWSGSTPRGLVKNEPNPSSRWSGRCWCQFHPTKVMCGQA